MKKKMAKHGKKEPKAAKQPIVRGSYADYKKKKMPLTGSKK